MFKRIIVVEDNRTHANEAFKLNPEGQEIVNVCRHLEIFKRILLGLTHEVKTGKYKKEELAVLTDLFFPAGGDSAYEYGDLAPLGLMVMAECQRLEIPCIIVTAGHHHGLKYNQACFAGRVMGWPEMVDFGKYDDKEEAKTKDWAVALKKLEEVCNNKTK